MPPQYFSDIAALIDTFHRESGRPPQFLISRDDTREKFLVRISQAGYHRVLLSLPHDKLAFTFMGIPWYTNDECPPDMIYALPGEQLPLPINAPADYPSTLHPPA